MPETIAGRILAPVCFVVSKVAIGKTGRFTSWVLNGMKNSGLVNFRNRVYCEISFIYL